MPYSVYGCRAIYCCNVRVAIFRHSGTLHNVVLADKVFTNCTITSYLLLLSFLDSDRDIGHQQCQLSTELLTGSVVSNQARFCLDCCTPFPQFVSTSHMVTPFFPNTIQRITLHSLSGHWRLIFSQGMPNPAPFMSSNDHITSLDSY